MKKIGAITIGQTPRTDLVPEITPILGNSIELIQLGGLDGLTREEIAAMTPGPGDHVLVSRLTDGSSVSFGEAHILPRLQACLDRLKDQKVSLILFLCTGEFPETFQADVPLLFPSRLLTALVSAIHPGHMTVITPVREQLSQMESKWGGCADAVCALAASPYDGLESVLSAARRIPEETGLVVLDCIGYTVEMKERIQAMTGKPVLLPRTLAARMVRELL